MNNDTLQISEGNILSFLIKFEEAVKNGFSLCQAPGLYPTSFMDVYVATMQREVPEQKELPKKTAGRPAKVAK